jgi:hypothetical protein
MANPSYVRLAVARQLTMVADVTGGTGWAISGADVKPFPKDPAEQEYVKGLVRQGVLEPCSKAEYEEVQEANEETFATEAERQEAAAAATAKRQQAAAEASAEEEPVEEEPPPPNTGASGGGLPPSEAEEAGDDLDGLTVPELRQRLKDADQPTSGNKEELLERLRSVG